MRRILIGLALALATLLLLAWLTSEMLEGETARFDGSIRDWVHAHSSDALTAVMQGASLAGSPAALAPAALVILVLLWRSGRLPEARLLVVALLGALLLELILKLVFHRARPAPFFGLPAPQSFSYPSGHALFAMCFCGALAWIFAARLSSRLARTALWVGAISIAVLIGYSRIYLGVHYPTDVIAGYASALVWLTALETGGRWRAR